MSAERIQVGALPSECWRIVPNHGGEVTDRYELVARADPPDQAIKVEPQVATTVPVVEPMVEIEPVYVAMTA